MPGSARRHEGILDECHLAAFPAKRQLFVNHFLVKHMNRYPAAVPGVGHILHRGRNRVSQMLHVLRESIPGVVNAMTWAVGHCEKPLGAILHVAQARTNHAYDCSGGLILDTNIPRYLTGGCIHPRLRPQTHGLPFKRIRRIESPVAFARHRRVVRSSHVPLSCLPDIRRVRIEDDE